MGIKDLKVEDCMRPHLTDSLNVLIGLILTGSGFVVLLT